MQKYFAVQGDERTASKFHLSSMEFVRSLGGDPLCLVTELPLYIVSSGHETADRPGRPSAYLALREKLPEIKRRTGSGQSLDPLLENFDIRALPLVTAASILLGIIQSVLRQIVEDQ